MPADYKLIFSTAIVIAFKNTKLQRELRLILPQSLASALAFVLEDIILLQQQRWIIPALYISTCLKSITTKYPWIGKSAGGGGWGYKTYCRNKLARMIWHISSEFAMKTAIFVSAAHKGSLAPEKAWGLDIMLPVWDKGFSLVQGG